MAADYPGSLYTKTTVTDDVTDVLAAHHNDQEDEILAIETELGTDVAGSASDLKTRIAKSLADDGTLEFADSTVLTISSGAVTVTQNFHRIATEGGAGSDYLATINGLANDGTVLFIRPSRSNDVIIDDGEDNIECVSGGDITLADTDEWAILIYDGNLSKWLAGQLTGGSGVTTNAGAANSYIAVYTSDTNIEGTDDLQWNGTTLTIGDGTAGRDYVIKVDGQDNDLTLTYDEDNDLLNTSSFHRHSSANYRRYYHLPLSASDPGAAGATWTAPDANQVGGWQLDAAGEILYLTTDIHSDWDAASDLDVEVSFTLNTAGTTAGDTVDLKLVCYYAGEGDTSTKTQTQEVATTVDDAAQYTQFKMEFNIDYDIGGGNDPEVGDVIGMMLNLETDTSEVDDIIINDAAFYYHTTHVGIESGDV